MPKQKFILSKLSLNRLEGVHPVLVSVVRRAIELTQQDFMVVEGVRSVQQCYVNWGKGRTAAQCTAAGVPASYAQPKLPKVTWLSNPLNSKHCVQKSGFGHAVDLVPYPVDWNDLKKFQVIANAMKAAAIDLGVKITWGGDWKTSKDYPHFEVVV